MATDIRQRIQAMLEILRGEDEWSEDERTSHLFLVTAMVSAATEAPLIAALSHLPVTLCELYRERALLGQIFDANGIAADYSGDQASVAVMLDAQVLQGLLNRHSHPGRDAGYSLTANGKRYVEEKLLPHIAGPEVH